jgi:DNA ligase 1
MGGRSFFAEDKLDGIRAQVHKSASRVEVYSRTMDAVGESFPEIVETVSRLPGEFLLDGEIVPWDRRSALAELLSKPGPGAATLQSNAGAGEVAGAAQITAAFESARGRRNEGIVLKDPDSVYAPGRRGQMWLKLKTHLPTLDCVVTAAEYGHGKRRNVLSDYTFAVWDRDPAEEGATLVNVGKAYSGVTDEEIARLTEIFLNLSRENNGRVHLVEPKIVLEIACDQIQKSKRHASGYAFRFPRIKRIRWDKGPADADRLDRVREIFQSHANFAHAGTESEPVMQEPTLFDGLA